MRNGLFAALLVAGTMGLGATAAEAQEARRAIGFNVGVGPTIPIGDDKGVGTHLNLGLNFGLQNLPLGLRLEGLAQRIPEGNDHHDYLGGSVNAEVGLPLEGLRPYLIGGVGAVWHREHHGDHHHDPHTDLAFNIGVGTQIGLFGLNGYVEARLHRLFGGHDDGHGHGHGHDDHTGNTFIPVTFGIRF